MAFDRRFVAPTPPCASAIMGTYRRADLAFDRGEGCYLFSTKGRRYLDFAAGIAVSALGHAHPAMINALIQQAQKLWHTSNLYTIPEGEKLARLLCDHSFAEKVFFCNSGAEALEGAIKTARKYHAAKGQGQKARILCCDGAFHGRTLATLSAAGNQKYLEGFGPYAGGFDHVPLGDANALRAAITGETAAILVEPIQGEGGINCGDLDYLCDLRRVCDEFGILLIFDEVQCGIGRTGKFFAHEWTGITPDILASAKGLGGGFPVGCFMATQEVGDCMRPGTHGSTYGGNPLAMVVAKAVVEEILKPELLDNVQRQAAYLQRRLEKLVIAHSDVFTEWRGRGLMLGLKVEAPLVNDEVVEALCAEGLLTVGASQNVIRLLPPLIVSRTEIDEALAALEKVATKLECR